MRHAVLAMTFLAVAQVFGATWFVHPVTGSDEGDGSSKQPWKTFAPVNALTLGPGDEVKVMAPGPLEGTLQPKAKGTAKKPVRITFARGEYDWLHGPLLRKPLYISNTNDAPQEPKAIAMALEGAEHLRIEGAGATFFMRGKTVMLYLKACEDVTFKGFGLDYRRPTVSEYTVEEVSPNSAIVKVHPDSRYRIEEGKNFVWVYEDGETRETGQFIQQLNPETGWVRNANGRGAIGRNATAIEDLGGGRLKISYTSNPGFEKGSVYQHRLIRRDCAGVFCEDSSKITYDNVRFHFLHGMGVVSQFSRDLTFKNVEIAPRKDSGRTCAAWADMLHFSGCAGAIEVTGVHFSGSNDDAINVHGTHLRLMNGEGNRATVRFMHPQTYGFNAFHAGDEVDFVKKETLVPYATRTIETATLSGDGRTMNLTFTEALPEGITWQSDALENVTWTPSLKVSKCVVERIPTRGFLVTTRQPVVIENTVFHRTNMHAILIEDDAKGWYESGPVRDMTIRGCSFEACGEPMIRFNPENTTLNPQSPVHSGIKISRNTFYLQGSRAISLKSTGDVIIEGNTFHGASNEGNVITQNASSNVQIRNNRMNSKPKTPPKR